MNGNLSTEPLWIVSDRNRTGTGLGTKRNVLEEYWNNLSKPKEKKKGIYLGLKESLKQIHYHKHLCVLYLLSTALFPPLADRPLPHGNQQPAPVPSHSSQPTENCCNLLSQSKLKVPREGLRSSGAGVQVPTSEPSQSIASATRDRRCEEHSFGIASWHGVATWML